MKKRLIYRLSSLGDIVLATEALEQPFPGETHWVIASEFAGLLKGDPRVHRVVPFDRRSQSASDWLRMNRELISNGNYDEIWDLHRTWRTLMLRWWVAPSTPWRTISKERLRRLGYVTFKRLWPVSLRPLGLRKQIRSWQNSPVPSVRAREPVAGSSFSVGMAPASAWKGKEWPAERFVDLAQNLSGKASLTLFGTLKDQAAVRVRSELLSRNIDFDDQIGKLDFEGLRKHLASQDLLVACDSGLAHLAEAVGTPVVTIYGPTRADFGFGPKLEASRPVETALWCSPCGKDGAACFRPIRRFRCLDEVRVDEVLEACWKVLKRASPEQELGHGIG